MRLSPAGPSRSGPACPGPARPGRAPLRALLLAALLPGLAGCLPASGPRAGAILAAADERTATGAAAFDVIPLDAATADRLAEARAADLGAAFGAGAAAGPAPDIRIGTGDTLTVTIYEATSGGLFSGDPGAFGGASKSIALPPQPVARDGTVSVPYVGQVQVAGLTPAQVQATVEAGLRDKAIEPQVLVTVGSPVSTFVTVAGDVSRAGRIPLSLDGDRLLDVVATAGGSRAPAYDTFVRLTRGSQSLTVPLSQVVNDPRQNIYLRPDDQLFLIADPQIYTAFGATAEQSSFRFETDRLTLAEAVGRAGGILDNRANARGIFVFRYETPDAYAQIRPGNPDAPQAAGASPGSRIPGSGGGVPVIYQLDLKEPNGYFAASRFLMRDNDILYVSNAPTTDLQKIFSIIGGGVGTASATTGYATRLGN